MSEVRSTVETVAIFLAVIAAAYLGIHAGAALTPTGMTYSWNLYELVMQFVRGAAVPTATWPIGVVLAAVVVVALVLGAKLGRVRRDERLTVGRLAAPYEHKVVRTAARQQEAERLHPGCDDIGPGLPIGRVVTRIGNQVYQGWEEAAVYLFGTRRGKTSSMVVPHCAVAPGGLAVTSNKPDGVREILALRSAFGEAYVYDPNKIVRTTSTPDFTYNPLVDIHTPDDARELAEIFEASTRKSNDRGGDAQFDEPGRDLLAAFLLAASLEGRTLRDVYGWLVKQQGVIVADLLRKHGVEGPADNLDGISEWANRTRQSVYATSQRMGGAMANDALLQWTTPMDGVRVFDPASLAKGRDTLVLLSKNGTGSGSAFVTALVRAVCKSAQQQAEANGGRLPVPLVLELDECANVVRWPELPEVYSFYGSLGIVLSSYFQSPAQAVAAFGKEGWESIWGAAVTRCYGGGVADSPELQKLSNLIGDFDEVTDSTSGSTRQRAILSVKQLGSMRKWRVVVFNSNTPPILVKARPWFRTPSMRRQVKRGATA